MTLLSIAIRSVQKEFNRASQYHLAYAFFAFAVAIHFLGPLFFINRTASMPMGMYLKLPTSSLESGDIIVLKSKYYPGNLIKHVAATAGSEFCFDENGGLWIDGSVVAQKNIQKYPANESQTSTCQILAKDELLVLGDHENSFDSRYFGPVNRADVITTVRLIWHWN